MYKYYKLLLSFFLLLPFYNYSQGTFQVYFGNLHSHTGNSDGTGTPAEAFAYAKDTAHLDFMAVTDHVEQVDILEWWSLNTVANNATTNGTFVAFAGYEWGSPLYGHCNQFNTSDLLLEIGWFYTDWDGFRQWIIDNPPSFGEFNHPGDEIYFTNWDDFGYQDAQSDTVFPLIEFQSIQQATDWYEDALKKGWHLSPVWNQDNHSANWGTKDNGRAGIWATDLSRAALYDAIKKRRTFATTDKNASVWLDVCGFSTGANVPRMYNSPVHIRLNDADNESWSMVELVSQNGLVTFFSSNSCPLDTLIYLSPVTEEWIFIRVTQADGDMLWSSPVHFTGTISGTENQLSANEINLYNYPDQQSIGIELPNNAKNTFAKIEVITTMGQIIKTVITKDVLTIIDLSKSNNNIYIIKVTTPNGISTKKLVK